MFVCYIIVSIIPVITADDRPPCPLSPGLHISCEDVLIKMPLRLLAR